MKEKSMKNIHVFPRFFFFFGSPPRDDKLAMNNLPPLILPPSSPIQSNIYANKRHNDQKLDSTLDSAKKMVDIAVENSKSPSPFRNRAKNLIIFLLDRCIIDNDILFSIETIVIVILFHAFPNTLESVNSRALYSIL